MNLCIMSGRLTKDPKQAATKSGDSISNFSIAINEGNDKVTFINIVAFRRTAEACNQYLAKGSEVIVEGRFQCRKWTDKDENSRETWEVIANRVHFVGGGGKRNGYDQRTGNEEMDEW